MREMAASRERVFETWMRTLPDWWGPRGSRTITWEIDPRPGGVFRTVLRTADGGEFRTRGVFLEVTSPERIVFTDAFDPGWEPHPCVFFTGMACFRACGAERTRLEVRALHWSVEARDEHERMGFRACWGEMLDRLAARVVAAGSDDRRSMHGE
jgi:uncharacterized protein YndB with AHSA1/START domain